MLPVTVLIALEFVRASVITAAPQKHVQFLFENRLDRGANTLSQTILDWIIARFIGQKRKRSSVSTVPNGVIPLAVAAAGWVGSVTRRLRNL